MAHRPANEGPAAAKTGGVMATFLERLRQLEAQAELAERNADPWQTKLQDAVRGLEFISTAALLDMLREQATTAPHADLLKTCARSDLFRSSHVGSCPAAIGTQ